MKYGLIKDNIAYIIGELNNGVWSGNIYYNADKTRKTGEQIVSDLQLKEVIIPSDFSGNSTQYNFIEQDGKIIIADMKADVQADLQKRTDLSRIAYLKKQLSNSDYKVIKCSEYSLLGLDMPCDVTALTAERKSYRDEINLLENKWRLK